MKKKAVEVQPLTREAFEALPVVEQRKVLARDILAAIDAGRMKGNRTGRIFSDNGADNYAGAEVRPEAAVVNAEKCFVCAIGAPMVAAARLVHRLDRYIHSLWALGGETVDVRSYLAPFFPEACLRLMEAAYEQTPRYIRIVLPDAAPETLLALSAFRRPYNYGTPRLRAIWQRVADDPKGLFRLEGL